MSRLLLRLGAVLTLLSALVVGLTSGASAATPTLQGAANLRDCVAIDRPGCGPTAVLPAGTPVTMVCWLDGSWSTGAYATDRWLYLSGGGRTGFVHASWVVDQVATPACGEDRGVSAVRWAAEQVGETAPAADVAAGLGIDDGRWSGWCAGFTYGAYRYGAGATPRVADNAAPRFRAYRAAGVVVPWTGPADVPVGAMVFWPSVAAPYGHTALYAGNGAYLSTTGFGDRTAPIARVAVGTWGTPAGWVPPGAV